MKRLNILSSFSLSPLGPSAEPGKEGFVDLDMGESQEDGRLDKLINEPTEGNAWHADHIVPVHKGGGECRLENMRTLCVVCHSDVTATQRAEQRTIRKRAKEQLRIVMKELLDNATVNLSVEQVEFGNGTKEEGLLVNVPGSAYFPKVKAADED
ncbi:hypothetical protein Taro_006452 [Colocasia esculenta]|uniref:HNH domain-containing protein n=1 Tax=Colocasia esculenta TaxID=4460 RepID=A0A843TNT2_COLES|nr:hypothetical protein [Colocasia esculenta]